MADQLELFGGAGKRSPVIPFGRFKGRPYEALVEEPDYAQYLLRSKYGELEREHPTLLLFLVKRFGMPDRTPAHNRLQNRFLDPSFALRMAIIASKEVREMIGSSRSLDVPAIWRKHAASTYRDLLASKQAEIRVFGTRYVTKAIDQVNTTLLEQAERIQVLCAGEVITGPEIVDPVNATVHEFEDKGSDVSYSIYYAGDVHTVTRDELGREVDMYIGGAFYGCGGKRFTVEIKPVVGDDYPNILRQMKTSRSNQLLVGEFRATSASWDEVVKIFAMSKISVAHMEEVERTEIPLHCTSLPVIYVSREEAFRIAEEEFVYAKGKLEASAISAL